MFNINVECNGESLDQDYSSSFLSNEDSVSILENLNALQVSFVQNNVGDQFSHKVILSDNLSAFFVLNKGLKTELRVSIVENGVIAKNSVIKISNENCQKMDTSAKFVKFVDSHVVKISSERDNVSLFPKLLGGGGGDDDLDEAFDNLKVAAKKLDSKSRKTIAKTVCEVKEQLSDPYISAEESRSLFGKLLDGIKFITQKIWDCVKSAGEWIRDNCTIF